MPNSARSVPFSTNPGEKNCRFRVEEIRGGAALRRRIREKSVHDLEARAVAADGHELAKPFGICAVRVHGGFAGSVRFAHLEEQTRGAESVQCARGQLSQRPPPAAGFTMVNRLRSQDDRRARDRVACRFVRQG